MKHTYTNISVEIPGHVYATVVKLMLDNDWEYTQKSDERDDMQFVKITPHRMSGKIETVYLQRMKVIYRQKNTNVNLEKDHHYLSVNVAFLKRGENNTYFSHLQEIQDGKDAIEEFLAIVGFEKVYVLNDIMIGYANNDQPYIWEN